MASTTLDFNGSGFVGGRCDSANAAAIACEQITL